MGHSSATNDGGTQEGCGVRYERKNYLVLVISPNFFIFQMTGGGKNILTLNLSLKNITRGSLRLGARR